MEITAYQLAERFVGIKEVSGKASNPVILSMLRLDEDWVEDDLVPWCSAFVNYIAWLLRLPRSKSLRARSWLNVGTVIELERATPGFDVVILSRGANSPGPDVVEAPGHVGFFAGLEGGYIHLLGGNQNDQVSIGSFPRSRLLGVRRIG